MRKWNKSSTGCAVKDIARSCNFTCLQTTSLLSLFSWWTLCHDDLIIWRRAACSVCTHCREWRALLQLYHESFDDWHCMMGTVRLIDGEMTACLMTFGKLIVLSKSLLSCCGQPLERAKLFFSILYLFINFWAGGVQFFFFFMVLRLSMILC